jgi:Ca2+-binding RTX toxin-like protein
VRFPAIAAGAIAVTAAALIPSFALAAPTKVTKGAAEFTVIAAPGTDNDLTITYGPTVGGDSYSHFVSDTVGALDAAGAGGPCSQLTPTKVQCGDSTSVGEPGLGEDFTILLKDGRDVLTIDSIGEFDVYGGSGNDTLIGNNLPVPGEGFYNSDSLAGATGKDLINGRGGPDYIIGGKGRDLLRGGEGNDNIGAKDGGRDFINCGPGKRDLLLMDRKIDRQRGCEVVERR